MLSTLCQKELLLDPTLSQKKAGPGLVTTIRKPVKQSKRKLEIPSKWLDNLIVKIFKKKGSRKILKYYRGVFLGNILEHIHYNVSKGLRPRCTRVLVYCQN